MRTLYRSHRERRALRWKYFGRPFLLAFGIAALVGLAAGVVWTAAGLWHAAWAR